jgi:hypothetical protein
MTIPIRVISKAARAPGRRRRAGAALAALAFALHAAAGRGAQMPDGADMNMPMAALLGPYAVTREGSGTSWAPDSTPMSGLMNMHGPWSGMIHGFANLIYDDQGGPRGDTQTFSNSMLMLMARRELTDGAFGLRLMLSGDPFIGKRGYPLLFQTGETADGKTPLIDRQHPHDLLMEAAATYSHDFTPQSSGFLYVGLPGEPALGPEAFMHRLSGMDNPEAPLSHHWLDSTHVAWGVVTGGYTWTLLKLEASAFNGREPDQFHYNIETRGLDSYSVRATVNPTANLSMQTSYGHLMGPEQLQPNVNVSRTTASATYNAPVARWWQTTVAVGHNSPSAGAGSNAWLLESALKLGLAHTVFARAERVGKDELFLPGQPLYGPTYTIEKLSVGYIHDLVHAGALDLGLGALVSTYSYPSVLNSAYGYRPTSFMVFVRARL